MLRIALMLLQLLLHRQMLLMLPEGPAQRSARCRRRRDGRRRSSTRGNSHGHSGQGNASASDGGSTRAAAEREAAESGGDDGMDDPMLGGLRQLLTAWTVVHVDVQLKHPRLLWYSTDGRAVWQAGAAPSRQLAHSTSVVLTV